MPEGLIVPLFLLAALMGVGVAAFLVMRSPAFWADVAKSVVSALVPEVIRIVSKRMTPQQEEEFQKAVRRGQEWDAFRKRPRRDR